jgi:predicted nucleic acid-binding protein
MTGVFADTYYFLALVNQKDAAHQKALRFSQSYDNQLLTTSWIITELADGLSSIKYRPVFAKILDDLRADPHTIIIPHSEKLFYQGIDINRARSDKSWSLTDCISFVVMRQYGLKDALTADRHFEQAGFNILL